MLKKIGDTLGVLGPREGALADTARDAGAGGDRREQQGGRIRAVLEKVAATLLEVEDTLDRELVRAVLPDGESPAGGGRHATRSSATSHRP